MNLNNTELKVLCEVARDAALLAGRYIQSQFDQHYDQQHKEGGDSLASQVVTAVDIKAQHIILDHLEPFSNKFDLGLLTEELTDDHSRAEKDYFWCIDPMDGTLPFTERRTGYAVSIALIAQTGDPVIGVVYIPDLEDCYTAIKGSGVLLNSKRFSIPPKKDNKLHFYMDQSFQSEAYYEHVCNRLTNWANGQTLEIQIHANLGGVRNAIGVMSSDSGCYFKFPKERKGCGSIWDYAATRLFFEELGMPVSNAKGDRLHLNNPNSTFMNDGGILYATGKGLKAFIINLGKEIGQSR